ncbi:Ger(x)C family spore germination protein [Bacillus wiedmannii]|uniref:Ger(x)C family spore germination protein n=1 Tax=Bacillus wiedmannii TaxID=1890302 RepID=UPI002E23D680|nr:Ger(x)C family spore germination protein [Bacillus wiedmannii]
MKKQFILFLIWISLITGCSSRVPLENEALILLMGIDIVNKKQLIIGTSATVFKTKKEPYTYETVINAPSIYSGISKLNSKNLGFSTFSKAQILIIGTKLAKQPNWIQKIDTINRDPFGTSNIKLVLADGHINSFFHIQPNNNLSLPTYVQNLLKSSLYDNRIVPSDIQEILRQTNEEGMTPTIPILKEKSNHIQTNGIGFLDYSGKYVAKLSADDVILFNILRNPDLHGRMILNIPLSRSHIATVLVEDINRVLTVGYYNNHFQFNIKVNMEVSMVERTDSRLPIISDDQEKNQIKHFEKTITHIIHKDLSKIVYKLQHHKIDPVGLGMYARAYQYNNWKQHSKNWGKAISDADIRITVKIKTQNTGTTRG